MFTKALPLMLLVSAGCIIGASLINYSHAVPGAQQDSEISSNWQNSLTGAKSQEPHDRVTDIANRANEWTEPSMESEGEYVDAVREWLNTLPESKREKARKILKDAHPTLHSLRNGIRDKKAQLASLTYGRDTTPETLPKLGLQLQQLKAELHSELQRLKWRLSSEANVDLGPLGRDAFWISLPQKSPPK